MNSREKVGFQENVHLVEIQLEIVSLVSTCSSQKVTGKDHVASQRCIFFGKVNFTDISKYTKCSKKWKRYSSTVIFVIPQYDTGIYPNNVPSQ